MTSRELAVWDALFAAAFVACRADLYARSQRPEGEDIRAWVERIEHDAAMAAGIVAARGFDMWRAVAPVGRG